MGPLRAGADIWRDRTGVDIHWEARSLRDFGDQQLDHLARSFDLLSIDHPFVGTIAETRSLSPLDEVVPADVLDELARDSIGLSHASYTYGGVQWALATDAACQVAALRDDLLLSDVPLTWDDVISLAQESPGRVALPLTPADAISSYLTLLANSGSPAPASNERFADPVAGLRALKILCTLSAYGNSEAFAMNPPTLLEHMSTTNEIIYIPLTFGYTNYSRPASTAARIRFADIPSDGSGPVGSVLGGAGLAVSAHSAHKEEAATFAAWLTGADAQRTVVVPAGGQPGSRAAWLDPDLDTLTGGFLSGTRETIEHAYLRPREPWWPPFQLAAGELLNQELRRRPDPDDVYRQLEHLYRTAHSE